MKKKIGYVFLTALLVGVFAATEAPAIESEFHGQFRINSYFQESSDGDTIIGGSPAEADDAMASRLRFRPTWDVSLDNGVAMHLQLNIGHINSNLSNARYTLNGSSSGDPVVSLRHGYISAPIPFYEACLAIPPSRKPAFWLNLEPVWGNLPEEALTGARAEVERAKALFEAQKTRS